jgi:membrane dipeptidase
MMCCCVFTGAAEQTPPGHSSKEGTRELDLPMAREGGFAGGLFAIFVPSSDGAAGPNETPSRNVDEAALVAPAVELTVVQTIVFRMLSLLLRIERESQGQVRVCRSVGQIQEGLKDGVLAAVLHLEGAEAIDPDFELLDVLYAAGLRSLGPAGADRMRSGTACRSSVPLRPILDPV